MKFLLLFFIIFNSFFGCAKANADDLSSIQKRGYLTCGVRGVGGIGAKDENGIYSGFEVDLCKAVAISILGDAQKTKFVEVDVKNRFDDLKKGKYDILFGTTTLNFKRTAMDGFLPTIYTFYDIQSVIASKRLNVNSLKELAKLGKEVNTCFLRGNNAESNFQNYLLANEIDIKQKKHFFEQSDFLNEDLRPLCDLTVNDSLLLMSYRDSNPYLANTVYLTDAVSFDAHSPFVRNDRKFQQIVKFVLNILLISEHLGITSENIDNVLTDDYDDVDADLMVTGMGDSKALAEYQFSANFVYNIIKNVGNYAEIYDRNIGSKSKYKMPRKYNELIKNGGIMYPLSLGNLYE